MTTSPLSSASSLHRSTHPSMPAAEPQRLLVPAQPARHRPPLCRASRAASRSPSSILYTASEREELAARACTNNHGFLTSSQHVCRSCLAPLTSRPRSQPPWVPSSSSGVVKCTRTPIPRTTTTPERQVHGYAELLSECVYDYRSAEDLGCSNEYRTKRQVPLSPSTTTSAMIREQLPSTLEASVDVKSLVVIPNIYGKLCN